MGLFPEFDLALSLLRTFDGINFNCPQALFRRSRNNYYLKPQELQKNKVVGVINIQPWAALKYCSLLTILSWLVDIAHVSF